MNRRDFIKNVTVGTALFPFVGNLNAINYLKRNVIDDEFIKLITDVMPDKPPAKPLKKHKVLVYSFAIKFYHKSIPYGNKCFEIMGEKTGAFEVVVSNDQENFSAEKLKEFDCIILNNCTGSLLKPEFPNKPKLWKPKREGRNSKENMSDEKFNAMLAKSQKKYDGLYAEWEKITAIMKNIPDKSVELRKNLMDWLKSGKSIVGIHAATDCSYKWKEYGDMIGGRFSKHPWRMDKVNIKIDEPNNPINKCYDGNGFQILDEIYQFNKGIYSRDKQKVLLSLDMTKTKNKGQRADKDYAISWTKNHGKGRVFYCSFGHRNDDFWNPKVIHHYLAGIQWALGDLVINNE